MTTSQIATADSVCGFNSSFPATGIESKISYAIARSFDERVATFRLVYENYVKKGLIAPNQYRMRVVPYHLLPTTTIFLARSGGNVVCTVTLIGDGELGLPMDTTNEDTVAEMRSKGCSIGEVSCLATQSMEFRSFLPIFVKLTRLMAQFARVRGMNRFVIATVPQHARFYKRFMGFKQVGEERSYPTVCDTRGVACCLDFDEIDRIRPACYEQYFGVPIPRNELSAEPLPQNEIAFFGPIARFAQSRLQTVT